MKYSEGNIKKVYMIKFDHKDNFFEELNNFVKKKNIRSGIINLIGALKKGKYVEGPNLKEPLDFLWQTFDNGKEILGIGSIFWKDDEPSIHIHGGFGGKDKSFVGCIREDTEVYLVVEAVIYETDIKASRKYDEETKLHLLNFEK